MEFKSTLRTSAFVSIALSTVAVVACLLTIPMMFQYVQRAESSAQREMDWSVTAPARPDDQVQQALA